MTWIKLDDNFPDHIKVTDLSDKAFRLYITLLCYCNRLLTDGYVGKGILNRFDTDLNHLELVNNKLIDLADDGGIYIRSYDEWQTLRSEVEKKRENSNARVTALRTRRRNADVTLPETETETDTETYINTSSNKFDDFWIVYPRKAGKQKAIKSWEKAVRTTDPSLIIEGAKRYASDPNRVAEFTAHPTTWLNAGRWEDEPLPNRLSKAEMRLDNRPTPMPPTYDRQEALRIESEAVKMPSEVKELINKIRYNDL
jgi:hypothetical protein